LAVAAGRPFSVEAERCSAYFAGILGYPFLSHFTLTLNYRDRVLQLVPAPK
jgi:hypothetical protein